MTKPIQPEDVQPILTREAVPHSTVYANFLTKLGRGLARKHPGRLEPDEALAEAWRYFQDPMKPATPYVEVCWGIRDRVRGLARSREDKLVRYGKLEAMSLEALPPDALGTHPRRLLEAPPLAPMEQAVVQGLTEGRSQAEIAAELRRHQSTISRIYRGLTKRFQ
jgi:hypothetical protein